METNYSGNLKDCVQKALFAFVKENIPGASLDVFDDIVLSYVISILEEVGDDEDGFDVDAFTEMLSAYVPAFENIPASNICSWLFTLSDTLKEKRKLLESNSNGEVDPLAYIRCQRLTESRLTDYNRGSRRSLRVSENSDTSSDVSSDSSYFEVNERRRGTPLTDDKTLKEQIIAKYSYQDVDDLKRDHKPSAPKTVPKKLVRYRDNKVVTLKGERFTEVKKEESDKMKKTYVNLKPARQYRFH